MGAKIRNALDATRMTADELSQRMKSGELFTILDTRNPQAWSAAESKLPGALRVPADEVEKYLDKIPRDRAIVTYCT